MNFITLEIKKIWQFKKADFQILLQIILSKIVVCDYVLQLAIELLAFVHSQIEKRDL